VRRDEEEAEEEKEGKGKLGKGRESRRLRRRRQFEPNEEEVLKALGGSFEPLSDALQTR
jgi:hypothetical protein